VKDDTFTKPRAGNEKCITFHVYQSSERADLLNARLNVRVRPARDSEYSSQTSSYHTRLEMNIGLQSGVVDIRLQPRKRRTGYFMQSLG
jgi:hypothetical protein